MHLLLLLPPFMAHLFQRLLKISFISDFYAHFVLHIFCLRCFFIFKQLASLVMFRTTQCLAFELLLMLFEFAIGSREHCLVDTISAQWDCGLFCGRKI